MKCAALIALALCHAAASEAAPVDDETPAILVPTWHPRPDKPVDPWRALPAWRVDGGAGFAFGDGADSASLHLHAGRSLWLLEHDTTRSWRTALRLTAGASLGADISSHDRAFWTAAPFVEVGVGVVSSRRQTTVFARAEPVLVPGALDERALRVGVGVTLHGFHAIGFVHDERDPDGEMLANTVLTLGLPILGALNVRDLEVTTDVGLDGRMQYGLIVGFGR